MGVIMSTFRRSVAFACCGTFGLLCSRFGGQSWPGLWRLFPALCLSFAPFFNHPRGTNGIFHHRASEFATVQRQPHITRLPKSRETALAVPTGPGVSQPLIGCEKAQAIIADYGFKDIKAELCAGKNLSFSATRDGKPFSIEIVAANGELAKVQHVH